MLHVFRKTRLDLMANNRVIRYTKYAIGEIFLVVIGILIALQINNYNEQLKENRISKQYLSGIGDDLEKDIVQVDRIMEELLQSIGLIYKIDKHSFIEDIFDLKNYSHLIIEPDTTKVKLLFYRSLSFRPHNGSYNSLISDGKSGTLKNRELFQNIQEIYDEMNLRISSTYNAIKEIESKVVWEYPYQKKHWGFSDLVKAKDQKIFLDLTNFTEQKYFYAQNLVDLKSKMLTVVQAIQKDIPNN